MDLELATAVTFFADNDDFLGGQRREQDPIYAVQGGLIYSFRRGIWAALWDFAGRGHGDLNTEATLAVTTPQGGAAACMNTVFHSRRDDGD